MVLAATIVRLAAGALVPLTEDEAYYRLWSMRPAFGYFDHPPMIAWQTWLGRQIAGDCPLGVRLIPTLETAATSLIVFDLARLMGLGERVAARAGVWLNATLLVGFGGELAVPDVPNALFWTATLWCSLRAIRGHGAWWLAAGAAAGLACLSKYSALFLAPVLLLWLALSAEGRRELRTPWPWLSQRDWRQRSCSPRTSPGTPLTTGRLSASSSAGSAPAGSRLHSSGSSPSTSSCC